MARGAGDRNAERVERSEMRRLSSALLREARALPLINIADPEQMDERCGLCFERCEELGLVPTYGAMAMFIGTSIDVLLKIRNGALSGWKGMRLSRQSAIVLQKNLELLESIFDVNFENGSYAQPVTGIFASKNLHGWKDTREVHQETVSIEITPEQIAARYQQALPMHVDSHGETHRLQEGYAAEAAAKTALALGTRAGRGEFADYDPEG